MNTDLFLLQSRFEAFKEMFFGYMASNEHSEVVWLNKYLFYKFERELLKAYLLRTPDAPDYLQIDERCFELQNMMDEAYLKGNLEDSVGPRYIP